MPDQTREARSVIGARQRCLQRTLERYGVLTRSSLRDLTGASRWQVPFDVVLRRSIRAGRVRALGADLFEAGDGRPPDKSS